MRFHIARCDWERTDEAGKRAIAEMAYAVRLGTQVTEDYKAAWCIYASGAVLKVGRFEEEVKPSPTTIKDADVYWGGKFLGNGDVTITPEP